MNESHTDYMRSSLDEHSAGDDPVRLLESWLEDARQHDCLPEPTAMALATVDAAGRPANRIVLARGIDARGLRFYTNYNSNKGRDLEAHPYACALFYWPALERQARIDGAIEKLPEEESDAYFAERPRGSQVGAWASPQSRALESREALEREVRAVERRFEGVAVLPRPPHWGGYLLRSSRFEFWQGRPNRLHDRIVFEQVDGAGGWRRVRLAP